MFKEKKLKFLISINSSSHLLTNFIPSLKNNEVFIKTKKKKNVRNCLHKCWIKIRLTAIYFQTYQHPTLLTLQPDKSWTNFGYMDASPVDLVCPQKNKLPANKTHINI